MSTLQITKLEAIECVALHVGAQDPIDGTRLGQRIRKNGTPPKETILDGHIVDRMVIQPSKAQGTWLVSVWPSLDSWKRDQIPQQFVAEWPGKVTAHKPGTPVAPMVSVRMLRWWHIRLKRIGKRWFKSRWASTATRFLLKQSILAETLRHQMKKPTLYAHPNAVDGTVHWDIIESTTGDVYGEGLSELEAWEDAARHADILVPPEHTREWRPPTKVP